MTSGPLGRGLAARLLAGHLVAPVGADPVEIGLEQPRGLLVLGPALAQQRQQLGGAQLVEPHAGEAALQDRAAHRAGIVIEAHRG